MHLQNLDSIEKTIGGYMLRKSNTRQKSRFLNSFMVPKNVKRRPFGIFNIHSVVKHQKEMKGVPSGEIENLRTKKNEKGNFELTSKL